MSKRDKGRNKAQKDPKSNVKPHPGGGAKVPRSPASPGLAVREDYPAYSFRFADRSHNGAWSWLGADDAHEVLDFLCEMARNTWPEIKAQQSGGHKKHHHQSIASLCKEAQDRLTELHYDELFSDVFRFRIGSRKRLWGSIVGGIFYVWWWDPEHQVYPTELG